MIVDDLRQSSSGGVCEVSARVRRSGSEELRLWWRFPEEFAPTGPDGSPFLAGVLVWAMRHGEDVAVDAPVSPQLLARVETIMAIFKSLYPADRRPVRVSAPEGQPPASAQLTGCFFTRGLDSWYAVLNALEDDAQTPPLTHLVFCPDFLSKHNSPQLMRTKTEATREAAGSTGLRFVEVRSNIKRDFAGAQLVSTALALGMSRMLLPSGAMHGEIVQATTHPVLDHRFSTERTQIVHYGDASRLDKAARIAQHPPALETLRVCHFDGPNDDNCGRCEKCVRTMLELHVVGALDRASTLPDTLDAARVAGVRRRLTRRQQWVHVLHSLGDTPQDQELAAAVRVVIAHSDLLRASDSIEALTAQDALAAIHPRLPKSARHAEALAASARAHIHRRPPTRLRAIRQRATHALLKGRLAEPLRRSRLAQRRRDALRSRT